MSDQPSTASILLVDDHPANLIALEAVLEPLGVRLVRATSGEEALKRVMQEELALILMDVQLPGLDGFQTAALIKQRERSRDIPILFITAIHKSFEHVSRGYASGAIDYISKPFEPDLLRAKVGAFVAFYRRGLELKQKTELAAREQAARAAAEAANRTKDEFLATVSHELRTPLNAMLGWGEMLRTGKLGELPERAHKAVEAIVRNARAQNRLVEDLLDVSRIVVGKLRLRPAPYDVAEVVRGAAETVRQSASARDVTLELTTTDGEPLVAVCDAQRVQQVAWNLLWNAVKFSPPGSRVEVSILREGEQIVLRVRDHGIGIAKSALPFLFEHFWQADRSTTRQHGGLGLGLAIVRRIVELHGGSIDAASDGEGLGATFTVRLPAADPAAPRMAISDAGSGMTGDARRVARDSGPRLEGVRVLVVDDEEDARELLAALLGDEGASLELATSADDALHAAAAEPFDVLVSDLAMPVEGGLSLIARLRALGPPNDKLPAIALTGYGDAEHRARALKAGFSVHMAKPFDPPSLITVVARLARGLDPNG